MVFNIFIEAMYVCVCKAVTDSQIHESIDGGAQSREEVTRVCGAGGDCGACHNMIEDMIEERLICPGALVRGRAA